MRDDNVGKATAEVQSLSEKCKEIWEAGKMLMDTLCLPEQAQPGKSPIEENPILGTLLGVGEAMDYATRTMRCARAFIEQMKERL